MNVAHSQNTQITPVNGVLWVLPQAAPKHRLDHK